MYSLFGSKLKANAVVQTNQFLSIALAHHSMALPSRYWLMFASFNVDCFWGTTNYNDGCILACAIDPYIALGPEDTGAEHERKRKFVALE